MGLTNNNPSYLKDEYDYPAQPAIITVICVGFEPTNNISCLPAYQSLLTPLKETPSFMEEMNFITNIN